MFFKKINEKLDFIIEQQGKDLEEYKKISKNIITELELELGYLYDTICPKCGNIAKIEIAIWENDIL